MHTPRKDHPSSLEFTGLGMRFCVGLGVNYAVINFGISKSRKEGGLIFSSFLIKKYI